MSDTESECESYDYNSDSTRGGCNKYGARSSSRAGLQSDDDADSDAESAVSAAPSRDLWSEMMAAEQSKKQMASRGAGGAAAQPGGGCDDTEDEASYDGASDAGSDEASRRCNCFEDMMAAMPLSATYDMSAYDEGLSKMGGISRRYDSADEESFYGGSSVAESEGYAPRQSLAAQAAGRAGSGSYGAIESASAAGDSRPVSPMGEPAMLSGQKRVATRDARPNRRRAKAFAVAMAVAATIGMVALVSPEQMGMGVMPDGDILSWDAPAS
jgi:hypothetical protein